MSEESGPPVRSNLPQHISRNQDFIGRDDVMAHMDAALFEGRFDYWRSPENTRRFTLGGTAGVGKTDIVVEYVLSRRSTKFSAVYWIDAKTPSDFTTEYDRFLSQVLQPSSHANTSTTTHAERNNPWLLVLDGSDINGDNADRIIVQLQTYFRDADCFCGWVIETTRDRSHLNLHIDIELQPLDDGLAAKLLFQRVKPGESWPQHELEQRPWLEVSARAEGLPLAIMQEADFIRNERLSIHEYQRIYPRGAPYSKIWKSRDTDLDRRYRLNPLQSLKLTPESKLFLNFIAFLGPGPISEKVFESFIEYENWYLRYHNVLSSMISLSCCLRLGQRRATITFHWTFQGELRFRMNDDERYHHFQAASKIIVHLWENWAPTMPHGEIRRLLQQHVESLVRIREENAEVWASQPPDSTLSAFLVRLRDEPEHDVHRKKIFGELHDRLLEAESPRASN